MNLEVKNGVMKIRRFIMLKEYVMKNILIKDTLLFFNCITVWLKSNCIMYCPA